MKRRNFLKGLLGAGAVVAAPALAKVPEKNFIVGNLGTVSIDSKVIGEIVSYNIESEYNQEISLPMQEGLMVDDIITIGNDKNLYKVT